MSSSKGALGLSRAAGPRIGPSQSPAARELLAARQLLWGVLGSGLLAGVERLAHCLRASDGARDLLSDLQAEGLELRDVDELDADVRDRMQGRMQRVDRVDRRQRDGGE